MCLCFKRVSLSPVTFFDPIPLKGTARAPAVDLWRINTSSGTTTAIITPTEKVRGAPLWLVQVTCWMGLAGKLKQLAVPMYKTHNNLSPSASQPFIHIILLRNSESSCFIPRPRTEYAKGCLHYGGSVLWKRIPLEIRHLPSF